MSALRARHPDLNEYEAAALEKFCAARSLDVASLTRGQCRVLLPLIYTVSPAVLRFKPDTMAGHLVVAGMVLRTLLRCEFGQLSDLAALDRLLALVEDVAGDLGRVKDELEFAQTQAKKERAARQDGPLQNRIAGGSVLGKGEQ